MLINLTEIKTEKQQLTRVNVRLVSLIFHPNHFLSLNVLKTWLYGQIHNIMFVTMQAGRQA